jgi:hypothetical protein
MGLLKHIKTNINLGISKLSRYGVTQSDLIVVKNTTVSKPIIEPVMNYEGLYIDLYKSQFDVLKKSEQYLSENKERIEYVKSHLELGFSNSELSKYLKLESEHRINVKGTKYYMTKYPNQIFLTVKELDRISIKWGLVYKSVSKYKHTLHKDSLKLIKKSKVIEDNDKSSDIIVTKYGNKENDFMADDLKKICKHMGMDELVFRSDTAYDLIVSNNPTLSEWDIKNMDSRMNRSTDIPYLYYLTKNNNPIIGVRHRSGFSKKMKTIPRGGLFILDKEDQFTKKDYSIETREPIIFNFVKGGVLIARMGNEPENIIII